VRAAARYNDMNAGRASGAEIISNLKLGVTDVPFDVVHSERSANATVVHRFA